MSIIDSSGATLSTAQQQALDVIDRVNSTHNTMMALTKNMVNALYSGTSQEITDRKAIISAGDLTLLDNIITANLSALETASAGATSDIALAIAAGQAIEGGAFFYAENVGRFGPSDASTYLLSLDGLTLTNGVTYNLAIDLNTEGTMEGDETFEIGASSYSPPQGGSISTVQLAWSYTPTADEGVIAIDFDFGSSPGSQERFVIEKITISP